MRCTSSATYDMSVYAPWRSIFQRRIVLWPFPSATAFRAKSTTMATILAIVGWTILPYCLRAVSRSHWPLRAMTVPRPQKLQLLQFRPDSLLCFGAHWMGLQ
jgi:Mn2+/Fe2+ NRAMP family transporter